MRTNLSTGLLILMLLPLLLIPFQATAQNSSAHVPTEAELEKSRRKPDPGRGYQRDSVASFGEKSQSTAQWVKDKLSGIHVTPARFLIGLGLLGILMTWPMNKRKVQWAVISVFSYILALLGAAGLFFRWPYMN